MNEDELVTEYEFWAARGLAWATPVVYDKDEGWWQVRAGGSMWFRWDDHLVWPAEPPLDVTGVPDEVR